MAISNPTLHEFAKGGTNKIAPAQTLVDSGWVFQEVPKSANMNYLFNQIFLNLAYIRDNGFYQFVTGTHYAKNALTVHAGIVYTSLIASNQGNTPTGHTDAHWSRISGYPLSSAINSSSTTTGATSKAAKLAYDKGAHAETVANGKLPKTGKAADSAKLGGHVAADYALKKDVPVLAGFGIKIVDFGLMDHAQRKVIANPFGNDKSDNCLTKLEYLDNAGKWAGWGDSGNIANVYSGGSRGANSGATTEGIVVVTGANYITDNSPFEDGDTHKPPTQTMDVAVHIRVIVYAIGI